VNLGSFQSSQNSEHSNLPARKALHHAIHVVMMNFIIAQYDDATNFLADMTCGNFRGQARRESTWVCPARIFFA
jgi:hypothetical protein